MSCYILCNVCVILVPRCVRKGPVRIRGVESHCTVNEDMTGRQSESMKYRQVERGDIVDYDVRHNLQRSRDVPLFQIFDLHCAK